MLELFCKTRYFRIYKGMESGVNKNTCTEFQRNTEAPLRNLEMSYQSIHKKLISTPSSTKQVCYCWIVGI